MEISRRAFLAFRTGNGQRRWRASTIRAGIGFACNDLGELGTAFAVFSELDEPDLPGGPADTMDFSIMLYPSQSIGVTPEVIGRDGVRRDQVSNVGTVLRTKQGDRLRSEKGVCAL